MPMKTSEREYRTIPLTGIVTRDADDGKMFVEGYATTFNQPYTLYDDGEYRLDEQIHPDAFKGTDMEDVIMQYDHEGRVFARKRNGTLELDVDGHGLKIRARLDGTDLGRQLFQEISGGYTDRMSFGFTVGEEKREQTEDRENHKVTVLRTITKIKKLYDVSAVSLPANDATEISARNLGEGVIKQIVEERHAEEVRTREVEIAKLLLMMGGKNHEDSEGNH